MKIDKIKKMSNGKYKILLENGNVINTYDDVILKTNILYTKEINDDIYKILLKDSDYYSIYNKTIKFISKRLRSKYEIEEYLNKLEVDKEIINKIIKQLKDNNFINDNNFCKAYIYDKFNLSSDGINKIKKDLLNFNIDEKVIDDNLKVIKEKEVKDKLKKIIDKKVKLDHKHSINMIKVKIKTDLINLGYDSYMIDELLSNIKIKSNIEKEYNSLYNKLKNKYEGNELEFKIRQKLYQKGYSSEEINDK